MDTRVTAMADVFKGPEWKAEAKKSDSAAVAVTDVFIF
jgi:hypothetical protein